MTTDYFGALLRSAGHPLARAAAVPSPSPGGADLVEIDAEREMQAPAGAMAAAQPQQPRQRPGAPGRRSDPGAMHTPPPTRQQDTRLSSPPPAAHDMPTGAPDVVDLSPPPAHTALQAALAWVASDLQGRPEAGLPANGERDDAVVRLSASATGIEEVTQEIETPAAAYAAIDGTDRTDDIDKIDDSSDRDALLAPGTAAGRRLAPMPAAPRRARAATAPREERVDVTIGAIHLHVDAPPPTAIAPAPAPASPAAAPSLRSPTPRSTLSRRALYRL